MKKPLLAIVLAALAIIGVTAFTAIDFMGSSSADSAAVKPGDCVMVTNHSDDRADVAGASCQDEKVTSKVGKVLTDKNATCPEGYTAIVPNTGDVKVCLLPNFVESACYQPDEAGEMWNKSTCAGDETVKVTKVISGAGDASRCPESEGWAYPEPPITYCVSDVQP